MPPPKTTAVEKGRLFSLAPGEKIRYTIDKTTDNSCIDRGRNGIRVTIVRVSNTGAVRFRRLPVDRFCDSFADLGERI